jgi:hypothetical protein
LGLVEALHNGQFSTPNSYPHPLSASSTNIESLLSVSVRQRTEVQYPVYNVFFLFSKCTLSVPNLCPTPLILRLMPYFQGIESLTLTPTLPPTPLSLQRDLHSASAQCPKLGPTQEPDGSLHFPKGPSGQRASGSLEDMEGCKYVCY